MSTPNVPRLFAFGLILAPACWGAFGTPAAGDRCYASVTSGTTASCTITNQPAAGDVIIYSGDLWVTLTISSVKDNAVSPNTFTIPTGTNLTSGCDTTNGGTAGSDCVAYLIEPNGSGGTTFTVTASGACGACSIIIDRFPVTSGTAAFDSAAGGHGTGLAITAPTITVSGSNELIWGGCTDNNTCTGVTGAWTVESGGLHTFAEGAEFQLSVSANTAVGFSGSSAADPWDSTGISFSFTPGGGGTPTPAGDINPFDNATMMQTWQSGILSYYRRRRDYLRAWLRRLHQPQPALAEWLHPDGTPVWEREVDPALVERYQREHAR